MTFDPRRTLTFDPRPPPSPSPRYKWGSVTHQSVGVVRSINRNGTDVCVDFPEQNNWTGLISEMEVVPGIHPRHMCVTNEASPSPFLPSPL